MNKRRYFNTCQRCGAHLDPGEKCDCQKTKQINKKQHTREINKDLSRRWAMN